MVCVNYAHDESINTGNAKASEMPATTPSANGDVPTVKKFEPGRLEQMAITTLINYFLLDSSEKYQLVMCIEYLIRENGADWVWENRDVVADLMEFHGFVRKSEELHRKAFGY